MAGTVIPNGASAHAPIPIAGSQLHHARSAPRPRVLPGPAGVCLYLGIEAVPATRAALTDAGFDVSPGEVTFYGMRECYRKDPDGRPLSHAEPSAPDEPVTITEL